jgi:RNA polymerase subunit RPABC4/transcription elongation factor Spt4
MLPVCPSHKGDEIWEVWSGMNVVPDTQEVSMAPQSPVSLITYCSFPLGSGAT